MPRLIVALLAYLTVASSNSTIEKLVYRRCLQERRTGVNNMYSSADIAYCTDEAKKSGDADRLARGYFIGLGEWKNEKKTLPVALLRQIVPCSQWSDDLVSSWKELFERRNQHEVTMVRPSVQSWGSDVGALEFNAMLEHVNLDNLEAAELLLQRSPPSDVGETFGRYHTSVQLKAANVSDAKLHSGVQTSCSSRHGEIMFLDLNADLLREAMFNADESIKLRVDVQARRQYIYRSKSSLQRPSRLSVVRQSIGLILHWRNEDEVSAHIVNSANIANAPAYSENSESQVEVPEIADVESIPNRNRRSPRINSETATTTTCRRIPHRMSRAQYLRMNIVHPYHDDEVFEIGLCSGICATPIPSSADPTNHAIVAAQDRRPLCCAVTKYHKPLFVTTFESRDNSEPSTMGQKVFKRFRASSCGCR